MSNINKIVVTGNVGQEPESKAFDSGYVLYTFSLAVKVYDGKEKKDVPHWLKVKTFSKLGEYIKKGSRLAVEGKLLTSVYENKDGVKVKDHYIMADNLEILDKKEKEVDSSEVDSSDIPF